LGEIRGSEEPIAYALARVARFLPNSRINEALARALAIRDNFYRVVALTGIAQRLTGLDHDRALSAALTAAKISIEMSEHGIQLGGLAGLAGLLSENQLVEIYDVVKNLEDVSCRIEGLSLLAPYLPPLLIKDMLVHINAIEGNGEKLDGFLALLPRLPEAEAVAVISAAVQLIKEVNVDLFFDDRLEKLAPFLSERELDWWLSLIGNLKPGHRRASWASFLIKYLPEHKRKALITTVLEECGSIFEEERAGDITIYQLTKCLSYYVGFMDERTLSNISGFVEQQTFLPARAGVFLVLLPYLQGRERDSALAEAISGTLASNNGYGFAECFTLLRSHLSIGS
jgi:hypothetical protein